jgi:hypothetical protein
MKYQDFPDSFLSCSFLLVDLCSHHSPDTYMYFP